MFGTINFTFKINLKYKTKSGDCNEFYLLVERIDIINKKKKGQKSEN